MSSVGGCKDWRQALIAVSYGARNSTLSEIMSVSLVVLTAAGDQPACHERQVMLHEATHGELRRAVSPIRRRCVIGWACFYGLGDEWFVASCRVV